MAEHDAITQATGLSIYFCELASPWERATNENRNGLLRQYFPKGTNLSVHSPTDLRRVQRELNNGPRKSLNCRTPAEVFDELVADLPTIVATTGRMNPLLTVAYSIREFWRVWSVRLEV